MTDLQLREQLGCFAIRLKRIQSVIYAVQAAVQDPQNMAEETVGALEIAEMELESISEGLGRLA